MRRRRSTIRHHRVFPLRPQGRPRLVAVPGRATLPRGGMGATTMKFSITHPMHTHPYNPDLVTGAGVAAM